MMLVGGKRSREYAEQIQNQFSIATQVLPGFSLEDIETMAVLGNIVERVLVLEQAWTIDGVSMDEREMRKRIGAMTKQARDRGGNEQYVFMARSKAMAQLCFEETYDICERAAVVLYETSATVVILHELLSTDIVALRPILVYTPPITAVVESYAMSIDVPNEVERVQEEISGPKRIIKKTRGAAIQRTAGENPWYAQQNGGNAMKNPNTVIDMFTPNQALPSDKGFADETPLVPVGAVELTGQLQHMFKQGDRVFAPQTQIPAATIPVDPVLPVSGDIASFIRSKAYRGYMLSFVGPGGSGSTFMALNCAARIYSAGFSVLFIDGDLTGHSAQYLTRLGITDDVLFAETDARVLRNGFTMYSASQFLSTDGRYWELPAQLAGAYDFIVADVPFHSLIQASEFVGQSARIGVTVDSSNWGIGKAAMALFSTPVSIAPKLRENGRLIYNRSDKLSSGLFGVQVTDPLAIKNRVEEVFGARASAFTALSVASVVGSYASAEEYWFSDRLFSDSYEGAQLFDRVLYGVLA